MKVLIFGAGGLIGQSLVRYLKEQSVEVKTVSLTGNKKSDYNWSYLEEEPCVEWFDGVDGVIHLAGSPIFGIWTAKMRQAIYDSRVQSTTKLCSFLAKLKTKPAVFIGASGINYYGYDQAKTLDESAPAGDGFLAEVCQAWEAATNLAKDAGIRVIHLRTGVVLSADGGFLKKLIPLYKLGLGCVLGSGKQTMSWIGINDLCRLLHFALITDAIDGGMNATAPNAISMNAFSKALDNAMNKTNCLRMPRFMVQLLLGDCGKETALSNLSIVPAKILKAGFIFEEATIEACLNTIFKK